MSSKNALTTRTGRGKTAPVTITQDGLEVIEAMAAEGQDQRTIAKRLGIDRKTLDVIRKARPEVDEAFERGLAALGDELTHHLLNAARNGNIVAMIYLTKARLGWREGDAPEAKPNITINLPDSQTPEAYMRTIRVVETAAAEATALPRAEAIR
ncbi:hypothetical protein [Altererythrobacter lauratis]|uniref:Helix-turn-helix domain-containing protein n=1 Tax=Alteraurantiacibacter lauratis TaxID=2054627 RepID=A0ABV7EGD6_9SPHN